MPGRRMPRELMAHLGKCRELTSLAEKVVEQCGLARLMGDGGLIDFDPLVVVMNLVMEEVEGIGLSFKIPASGRVSPDGTEVWIDAMRMIQEGNEILEHNAFLPCRWCDTAFEPVIDEKLLMFFGAWKKTRDYEALLAIHLCPKCGGDLEAKRVKKYQGDFHTPEPGSIENNEEGDRQWVECLLQHYEL